MSIGHNARAILKWIEHVWPQMEKSGNVMDLPPFNRKAKGESAPAVPEHYLDVMDANSAAGSLLIRILEEAEQGEKSICGMSYRRILRTIRENPAALRQPYIRHAALAMCFHLARIMRAEFGGRQIHVYVDPRDEEARPKTREAQKLTEAESRRRVVAEIERVEREHECTRKAAMGYLQDKKGWSIPKQRKAVEMVNREQDGAA